MTGLYLGGLLLSIAGLVFLDLRSKLFLGAAPRRAAAVLAIGVVGFLLWDAAGVGLGIFFEGRNDLLVGVDLAPQIPLEELFFLILERDLGCEDQEEQLLAPQIPLEELFFLILLCLSAMEAFALGQRLLDRGAAGRGSAR